MHQTSTLKVYIAEFRRLVNSTHDVGQILLKSCFLYGFKHELKFNVKLLRPFNVHEACIDTKLFKLKYGPPNLAIIAKPPPLALPNVLVSRS